MPSLKELMKDKLTEEEQKHMFSSYDIIGDIAVVEMPKELKHKEKEIAHAIKSIHKRVNVVVKKIGSVRGEERVRKHSVIYGENRTETIHKENGIMLKMDINKVYFSPRLAEERKRVAASVRNGETILALFCGVGPYPLLIAKKKHINIIAVDINKHAIRYLKENMLLNKVNNIIPVLGDVRNVVPKHYKNVADRIIMPIPFLAEKFLDIAFIGSKNKCIVHFYTLIERKMHEKTILDRIRKKAKRHNCKIKLLNKRFLQQYSPSKMKVVFDFMVIKN